MPNWRQATVSKSEDLVLWRIYPSSIIKVNFKFRYKLQVKSFPCFKISFSDKCWITMSKDCRQVPSKNGTCSYKSLWFLSQVLRCTECDTVERSFVIMYISTCMFQVSRDPIWGYHIAVEYVDSLNIWWVVLYSYRCNYSYYIVHIIVPGGLCMMIWFK